MSESAQEPPAPVDEPADALPATGPAGPGRVGSAGPDRPAIGWTEIGVAVGAYAVLMLVAGLLLLFVLRDTDPYGFPALILSGVATLAAVGIALAVRVRRPAALGLRATTWRWIALSVGAGLALRVLSFGVILGYQALTGDVSDPQQSLGSAAAGTPWQLAGVLLGGALLAPLAEELLLRGVLYGGLRRYGVPIALVVSAVVFGLLHGLNVVLPVAILLGVVNALFYERSRSIWPAFATHAVFNASGFALVAILT